MANVQKENGFVSIANALVDKLCEYRLSGQEWQILWVILRKTYGWNKKTDRIALSQFSKMTGIPRSKCHQILKSLINKNIVIKGVPQKGNTKAISYGIQKDFDKWKVFPKKVTARGVPQKGNKVFPKKGTKVFPKKGTTKYNKDTLTKDREFLNYFNEKTGKRYQMTSVRQRIINQRLKTHTLDQLKTAVDNFIKDDWKERYKYIDVVYCIGTRNKIDNLEKWLNYKPKFIPKREPDLIISTVDKALTFLHREMTTSAMIKCLQELPRNMRKEFQEEVNKDVSFLLLFKEARKRMKEAYKNKKRQQFRDKNL